MRKSASTTLLRRRWPFCGAIFRQGPVSDLCEELGLQPTVFYRWQKEFFENGAAAFQTPERPRHSGGETERIEFLEKKVQTKDEVLAELMAEHIALKKSLGNSDRTWVPHDVRDQVWISSGAGRRRRDQRRPIHFVLGVTVSKFYDWRQRYGRVNEHNGWCPRFLVGAVGKGSHHWFPSEESIGRLSATDIHDVRSRCSGSESGERMARAETSGTAVALER